MHPPRAGAANKAYFMPPRRAGMQGNATPPPADAEITIDQMYRIENRGHEMGFPKKFMMENAGAAVARRTAEGIGDRVRGRRILVLAGPGNNGGDGLVAARHLAGRGAETTAVLLLGRSGRIKTEECSWNWSLLGRMPSVRTAVVRAAGGGDAGAALADATPPNPDAIIDAVFGTGLSGPMAEPFASAISMINRRSCFALAVDSPSGLDYSGLGGGGNAGAEVLREEERQPCARVDATVTFHRARRGLAACAEYTGELHVEPIGIPPEAEEGVLD